MIKLKDLKIGNEYYIIDEDGDYNDAIIKFIVIEKLKGGAKKGFVVVQFQKYIGDNGEVEDDVTYGGQEDGKIVTENIYVVDEKRLFDIDSFDSVLEGLREVQKETESRQYEYDEYDFDDYMSPEEYPDWDGDESIMYYIDNYEDDGDYDYEDDEDDEVLIFCNDCDEDFLIDYTDVDDEILCPMCGAKCEYDEGISDEDWANMVLCDPDLE